LLLSADQRQRGHLCRGEPANVLVRVTCRAPAPATLLLHSISLQPAMGASATPGGGELLAIAEGTQPRLDASSYAMRDGSEYSALFCMVPTADVVATSLGTVRVLWSRAPSDASSPTEPRDGSKSEGGANAEVSTALPPVDVRRSDFGLVWQLPTEGSLGEQLTMSVRVTNHTAEPASLKLTFAENDAFLFCGHKLYRFLLPPAFAHTLTFNLVPIRTGAVRLPIPKLQLVSAADKDVIDPAWQHRVFVRPTRPAAEWAAADLRAAVTQSA